MKNTFKILKYSLSVLLLSNCFSYANASDGNTPGENRVVNLPPSDYKDPIHQLISDVNTLDHNKQRTPSSSIYGEIDLEQGKDSEMLITVGGSKTVKLPTTFDKVLVVSPDIASVVVLGPKKIQILGRTPGVTDVVFAGKNDNDTFKIKLTVGLNMEQVQDAINRELPDEHITASSVNGAVVLSGTTRDATTANAAVSIAKKFVSEQNVINQIHLMGGQQVMLKVQVSEVYRTVIKQLGMDTAFSKGHQGVIGNDPQLIGYTKGSEGLKPYSSGGSSNSQAGEGLQPLLAMGAMANPIGFISSKFFGATFTSVASALEQQGLLKVLSEPNLVTQSGKTAHMMAGEQYPVPQVSQTGTTGTQYKPFGVSLSFTPTVLSPENINLDISTEVSSLGNNVSFPSISGGTYNVPIFNTRKADTTVELPSGGSIVIAGLLQDMMQSNISGLPGIKDAPILGKLLSSTSFQRNETEMVVSVTVYLVQPFDASKKANPTDGLYAPNDIDLYFLNKITGIASTHYMRHGNPPHSSDGHFGYIME